MSIATRSARRFSSARNRLVCRLSLVAVIFVLSADRLPIAAAQAIQRSGQLPPAEVERIDAMAATHLENAQRFLAEKQWDEAVEAIRRVLENDRGQLVQVDGEKSPGGFSRWVPLREYCQWRLAWLAADAPEALARYRTLVDPLAEQWYREAIEQRREELLQRIIQQAFASRWGDDALFAAGEFRLQVADYSQARAYWERISPLLSVPPKLAKVLSVPVGSPLWLAARNLDWTKHGETVLAALRGPAQVYGDRYPDTDLDLAEVRARLVLVSVLEGSLDRARVELDLLARLHPEAEGRIAGREGNYTDLLRDWIEEARNWPPHQPNDDWPTFAGNMARNAKAVDDVDAAGRPIWSYQLPILTGERALTATDTRRVAEGTRSLLSYHPIVVGRTVFIRSDVERNSLVTALDLQSGAERWQVDYPRSIQRLVSDVGSSETSPLSDAHAGLPRHVGVARYTLTSADGKLFARMGSALSGPTARWLDRTLAKDQGWLLGLDLQSEGKPLEGFPIRPESSAWSFEGTPLYESGRLYVAMRRVDGPRTQTHVACFELPTGPTFIDDSEDDSRPAGRLRWRTKLVAGSTIGAGEIDELSHVLLSLQHGRLFCNTNLGAVACLSAESGDITWITTYPRAAFRDNDPDRDVQHFFRDLTPCLVAKDLAIVAPTDCPRLFALDQATGCSAWSMPEGTGSDIIHLLGTSHDTLIASGNALYWIDLPTGNLLTQYPRPSPTGPGMAATEPRGYGRGQLVGQHVYWPTREDIYVFEQQPSRTPYGWDPKGVREIPLLPRGATGGNLVVAGGVLLIASGDRLYAYDEQGPQYAPPATPAAH